MKKKIISAFLALVLMLSLAIPAFAAQYVSDGYYDGSYYEIVDNCTGDTFSGTIFCSDRIVYVTANVSYIVDDDYSSGYTVASHPQYGHSTVSDHVTGHLLCVDFKHYIDGNVVRNNIMYRS